MKEQEIGMLRQLCEAAGAGGLGEAAEVACAQLRTVCDEVKVDSLGNVIGWHRCGKSDAPLLLLEAHLDEIGMMVTAVDDGGFLKVAACGGIDCRVLAATEVTVWADEPLAGVVCSTPPHLSEKKDEVPELKDLGIDIGLPADEVKRRVPVGSRVTFAAGLRQLTDSRVCSKALDDRAGCAAVLMAMSLLKEETLCCDVAAVLAVQEELGSRGAATAVFAAAPDAAIITDVSFALTPDADAVKCGKLGQGPMLGIAPTLNMEMTAVLRRLAAERDMSLQTEVMGGTTGTDSDTVAASRGGVRTALLSIPQRYMHTPIEVVDTEDIAAVARLMAAYAKEGMTL